jgi:hypothetical protein
MIENKNLILQRYQYVLIVRMNICVYVETG